MCIRDRQCGVALGEPEDQIEATVGDESGYGVKRWRLATGLPARNRLSGPSAAACKLLLRQARPVPCDPYHVLRAHRIYCSASIALNVTDTS